MKRVIKMQEPSALTAFRNGCPNCTWEQMRSDGNGRSAYDAVRSDLVQSQGGICAFCEVDIYAEDPLKSRVEHFHPKSDTSTTHNWALDWQNMLAVCKGGSQRHQQEPYTLEPLEENLSCDAYKDQLIQSGRLSEQCEGLILNPKQVPAFPCLFLLDRSTGELYPDKERCAEITLEGNRHADTSTLAAHTIEMLNLNCDRLNKARLRVVWDIERDKKRLREQGTPPEQGLRQLAERYFRQQWPYFFTSIRFCLGTAAESYLSEIGFQD